MIALAAVVAVLAGLAVGGTGVPAQTRDDAIDAGGIHDIVERVAATVAGGAIAGLGGASLTLFYPGSWNEGISSGQGLIAVALVIFARWSPWRCVGAALLFGGAGAIGPALQSIGVSQGYYLFGAVPYVLTLVILVISCRPGSIARGSPGELSSAR